MFLTKLYTILPFSKGKTSQRATKTALAMMFDAINISARSQLPFL